MKKKQTCIPQWEKAIVLLYVEATRLKKKKHLPRNTDKQKKLKSRYKVYSAFHCDKILKTKN